MTAGRGAGSAGEKWKAGGGPVRKEGQCSCLGGEPRMERKEYGEGGCPPRTEELPDGGMCPLPWVRGGGGPLETWSALGRRQAEVRGPRWS